MTDTDWAGRGFTAAPGSYPELWQDLRAVLRNNGPLTISQVEGLFRGVPRRTLIAELAAMRDDGEVRFEGPRYVLNS